MEKDDENGCNARRATLPSFSIAFGREICGDLQTAESREWLVTNGLGGFASGTVAGHLTRRYHGFLVAALDPPLGRTLLVTKIDEIAQYGGETYSLASNRWAGGAFDPEGFRLIESFRLEGAVPVWTFACADALIEKRVWMEQGKNTTYVRYELVRAGGSISLALKVLVNYRDFHGNTHAGGWQMNILPAGQGLSITAFPEATCFYLLSGDAKAELAHAWYRNFDLSMERYRGLEDREDHLHAGTFHGVLEPGQSVTLIFSTEPSPDFDGDAALERRLAYERSLLDRWAAANPHPAGAAPAWINQLVLAADQFIVQRAFPDQPHGRTVIAGYHWFGDWGRDTMVALPGLTIATGRPEIARMILRAFGQFEDRGMLPNFFPEAGQTPEYNTVDAALWYFEALRQYYAATSDTELLRELLPVLSDIIQWYTRGTRYSIHVDSGDGLLYAGEPGVQLTWMDAKVGNWVVTPRIGKPVEVNALWLNALTTMVEFSRVLKKSATGYEAMAERARAGFERFWNEAAQCCFDVLDGPEGNDASLRPNQIFAVSLPESPLTAEQQRAVVDTCARHLLTSHGLRSLAPGSPSYRGRYGGPPQERDAAYHQGTVWGWLLGPFALAHWRVYRDSELVASLLDPMGYHLQACGLGSASEIFDGDPPFAPRGCIAQAWTVAETLRAWTALAQAGSKDKCD